MRQYGVSRGGSIGNGWVTGGDTLEDLRSVDSDDVFVSGFPIGGMEDNITGSHDFSPRSSSENELFWSSYNGEAFSFLCGMRESCFV